MGGLTIARITNLILYIHHKYGIIFAGMDAKFDKILWIYANIGTNNANISINNTKIVIGFIRLVFVSTKRRHSLILQNFF
jgi:hypothetical protein